MSWRLRSPSYEIAVLQRSPVFLSAFFPPVQGSAEALRRRRSRSPSFEVAFLPRSPAFLLAFFPPVQGGSEALRRSSYPRAIGSCTESPSEVVRRRCGGCRFGTGHLVIRLRFGRWRFGSGISRHGFRRMAFQLGHLATMAVRFFDVCDLASCYFGVCDVLGVLVVLDVLDVL